jgi:two-component system response regulator FlrC
MPLKMSKWVLVVDDDEDVRDALVDLLETLGYRALGVASAEQALKVIHDDPCMVLMDWQMRQMDGPALLAAMRAQLGAHLPPVVFITGSDASITKNTAEPVLSKPVDVGALLKVLRRHCPSAFVTRE